MKKALKVGAGAFALVAPLAIGWAIAAGASVGSLVGDPSHHTVDVFSIDGYEVEREDIDGTVTVEVTGPDGAAVSPDDIPAAVASELENWTPPEDPIVFTTDSTGACYTLVDDVEIDGEWDVTQSGDEGTRVARAAVDSGDLTVEAVYTDTELADSLVGPHVESGAPLIELPGAQPMEACNS